MKDTLLRYFEAWRDHDISKLREVFADNAYYIIVPRKRTLRGLGEISSYWRWNTIRQRDVSIEWQIRMETGRISEVLFSAHFRDICEGQEQKIHGVGRVEFSEGKIICLAEDYVKTVVALVDVK